MLTECIAFKNSTDISKPHIKEPEKFTITKVIRDNIILQIKIHFLYVHVDSYMEERIQFQIEKGWPLNEVS